MHFKASAISLTVDKLGLRNPFSHLDTVTGLTCSILASSFCSRPALSRAALIPITEENLTMVDILTYPIRLCQGVDLETTITEVVKSSSMIFSERLRTARLEKYKSQQAFAEALEVHPLTAGRWERGERTPDHDDVDKICKALGRSPSWFFRDDEEEGQEVTPAHALEVLREFVADASDVERLRRELDAAKAERDELRLEVARLKDSAGSIESGPPMSKGNRRTKDGRSVIGHGPAFGRLSVDSDRSESSDSGT